MSAARWTWRWRALGADLPRLPLDVVFSEAESRSRRRRPGAVQPAAGVEEAAALLAAASGR